MYRVMKHLKKLIKDSWDGDVTYQQAIEGFTQQQLKKMDTAVKYWPEIYLNLEGDGKYGVPFFDRLVNDHDIDWQDPNADGILLIQVMVNQHD